MKKMKNKMGFERLVVLALDRHVQFVNATGCIVACTTMYMNQSKAVSLTPNHLLSTIFYFSLSIHLLLFVYSFPFLYSSHQFFFPFNSNHCISSSYLLDHAHDSYNAISMIILNASAHHRAVCCCDSQIVVLVQCPSSVDMQDPEHLPFLLI